MDMDALIGEICARVQERMLACEKRDSPVADAKPGLLILSQDHGETCHSVLESGRLAEFYRMDCALFKEDCNLAEYEGVIAYTLTNEAVGKIANGILDTDYAKLFAKALLCGKKVFVPQEEVELYAYKDMASAAYYGVLEQNLQLLVTSGVVIVPKDRLISVILGACEPEKEKSACGHEEKGPGVTVTVAKKVLTERDLIGARDQMANCVIIRENAIVTDLAKDYARKYGMVLKRERDSALPEEGV